MGKNNPWLVVLALYFASVVTILNMFKVPPLMMPLMKELNASMVVGGWFMSVFSLAMIFLAFPVVILLKKYGPLTCGLIAIGSTVVGSAIGAVAPSGTVLLIGRAIEGISFGMIGVIAPAVIASHFPPQKVGLPIGIWATWYPLGSTLAYNLAWPIANATGGWRGFWWAGMALAICAFVLYALLVRNPQHEESDKKTVESSLPIGETLANSRLWSLGLVYGFAISASAGFLIWAPTYFVQKFNMPHMVAGMTTSIGFLASIPGNLLGGFLLTRLRNGHAYIVTVSLLILATYTWGFVVPISIIKPFLFVIGMLMGLVCVGAYSMVPATVKPYQVGVAMGFMSIMTGLDNLLGAPAMGFFVEGGNWTKGVLPTGVVLFLGLLCAIYYVNKKPLTVSSMVSDSIPGSRQSGKLPA